MYVALSIFLAQSLFPHQILLAQISDFLHDFIYEPFVHFLFSSLDKMVYKISVASKKKKNCYALHLTLITRLECLASSHLLNELNRLCVDEKGLL